MQYKGTQIFLLNIYIKNVTMRQFKLQNYIKKERSFCIQYSMNIIKIIQNMGPSVKQIQTISITYQQKQIYQAQQALIKALKQQLIRLQEENQTFKQQNKTLQKQLQKYKNQSDVLKQKVQGLKQNNQSLIHTFQVFQNQFVKRNKKQSFPVTNNIVVEGLGPFHLQIIRTVKSKINNYFIQPLKVQQMSQFAELYGYFFQQNSVEQEQVQLYNQLVQQQQKKVRPSKIRTLGKKNYFNQRFRHIFWFNAIQNKLKLTEKYYSLVENFLQENLENRPPKTSIIDLDIRRMDFRIDERKSGNLKMELKKLLELFEIYRPDIGYVQGMSYFGWMFLIKMNPVNSFIAFSNVILTDPFVSSLYSFNQQKIKKIVHFFQECLQDKKPKLFKYTKQLGVDSELFIIQWAYTFFTRAFSLKIVSKIWDLWFSEGFNVFFRVAMTIFEMLEVQLLETIQSDKYIQILRNNTFKLQENEFLKTLNKQKLFQELKLELV